MLNEWKRIYVNKSPFNKNQTSRTNKSKNKIEQDYINNNNTDIRINKTLQKEIPPSKLFQNNIANNINKNINQKINDFNSNKTINQEEKQIKIIENKIISKNTPNFTPNYSPSYSKDKENFLTNKIILDNQNILKYTNNNIKTEPLSYHYIKSDNIYRNHNDFSDHYKLNNLNLNTSDNDANNVNINNYFKKKLIEINNIPTNKTINANIIRGFNLNDNYEKYKYLIENQNTNRTTNDSNINNNQGNQYLNNDYFQINNNKNYTKNKNSFHSSNNVSEQNINNNLAKMNKNKLNIYDNNEIYNKINRINFITSTNRKFDKIGQKNLDSPLINERYINNQFFNLTNSNIEKDKIYTQKIFNSINYKVDPRLLYSSKKPEKNDLGNEISRNRMRKYRNMRYNRGANSRYNNTSKEYTELCKKYKNNNSLSKYKNDLDDSNTLNNINYNINIYDTNIFYKNWENSLDPLYFNNNSVDDMHNRIKLRETSTENKKYKNILNYRENTIDNLNNFDNNYYYHKKNYNNLHNELTRRLNNLLKNTHKSVDKNRLYNIENNNSYINKNLNLVTPKITNQNYLEYPKKVNNYYKNKKQEYFNEITNTNENLQTMKNKILNSVNPVSYNSNTPIHYNNLMLTENKINIKQNDINFPQKIYHRLNSSKNKKSKEEFNAKIAQVQDYYRKLQQKRTSYAINYSKSKSKTSSKSKDKLENKLNQNVNVSNKYMRKKRENLNPSGNNNNNRYNNVFENEYIKNLNNSLQKMENSLLNYNLITHNSNKNNFRYNNNINNNEERMSFRNKLYGVKFGNKGGYDIDRNEKI